MTLIPKSRATGYISWDETPKRAAIEYKIYPAMKTMLSCGTWKKELIQLKRALMKATRAMMQRRFVTIVPAITRLVHAPIEKGCKALIFCDISDSGTMTFLSVMGCSVSGIRILDTAREAEMDITLTLTCLEQESTVRKAMLEG